MTGRLIAALSLLFAVLPAWGVDEAGRAIFIAGTVTAERENTVTLAKDDPVFEKDVVVTAERSRAQLLMRDGAKIALRPSTRFVIEEYFIAGDEREQPDGTVVVSSESSAITELVKGGFRTITGAVGREDPDDYEVRTPAATMGIRGTHYTAVWCEGDCVLPPGIGSARRLRDGLYVGVSEGIVYLANNAGELLLRAGQYAYVRDRNTRPVRLTEMPAPLIDTEGTIAAGEERAAQDLLAREQAAQELRDAIRALGGTASQVGLGSPDPSATVPAQDFSARSDAPAPAAPALPAEPAPDLALLIKQYDSSTAGFEAELEQPLLTADGTPITGGRLPDIRAVALASGPVTGISAESFTSSSPGGRRTFAGNDLSGFQAPAPGTAGGDPIYAIGTAGIRDDGFDPATGFGWGRWTAGASTVTLADGSVVNVDLGAASLHWIYGPRLSSRPVMPITGTAIFNLISGNTDPTDSLGNSGVLGNASLTANFTTQTVTSQLLLAIGGADWQATGTGSITDELFDGRYDTVLIGGQAGGSGNFSGFFGAPAAGGFPGAAGLTYGLTDPAGVSVSGAVVFGSPTTP